MNQANKIFERIWITTELPTAKINTQANYCIGIFFNFLYLLLFAMSDNSDTIKRHGELIQINYSKFWQN
jgi:hypothetical protein